MKKINYLLLLVLMASCVSIKPSVFQPSATNCVKLPNLDPVFDFESFESFFGGTTRVETAEGQTTTVTQRTQGVQDVLTIFERNVRNCITDEFTENKGYIILKLGAANTTTTILPGVSVITGMLLNLIGLPYDIAKTFIDLEVVIYNNEDKLIGRYSGSATARKPFALYYGYSHSQYVRASKLAAFTQALDVIKEKIANDRDRLVSLLN